jgi:hypothetical protein
MAQFSQSILFSDHQPIHPLLLLISLPYHHPITTKEGSSDISCLFQIINQFKISRFLPPVDILNHEPSCPLKNKECNQASCSGTVGLVFIVVFQEVTLTNQTINKIDSVIPQKKLFLNIFIIAYRLLKNKSYSTVNYNRFF